MLIVKKDEDQVLSMLLNQIFLVRFMIFLIKKLEEKGINCGTRSIWSNDGGIID